MLKDQFNRVHDYLRISLTDKCNLRCIYCNPVDLPKGYYQHSDKMSPDEIDTIVNVFVQQGVKKIRLTGGEPLVRKDAKDIILRLAKYPVELVITTNGVYIDEYIDCFHQAGIRSVNVSLDSLDPQKNLLITHRDEFHRIRRNIELLLHQQFQVKINMVVMKGMNEKEIPAFVEWTKQQPVQVRFIEFMPFEGNHWNKEKVYSHNEILAAIASKYSFKELSNDRHDTAEKFYVPGHLGSFALISTMSRPFCSGCNRMRLTTDGKMKNCLFSKNEIDLLTALRKGEDIIPLIRQCVWEKAAAQGGQFNGAYKELDTSKITNRRMINIGG